CACFGVSW
nr:immunoglobulin heavy chain junction region [Macaca mulatta]MOV90260.1 immunoglobulin heavy chain junction region [Macaca mulatta]MOV91812.1 immunoglobulin heavy chain junction region [Macaca mulatta]